MTTQQQRESRYIAQLATTDRWLTQVALELAAADVNREAPVTEVTGYDYLTPIGPESDVDLTAVCGGRKDKWMEWRRG